MTPDRFHLFLCEPCGWKKVCNLEMSGLKEMSNDSMSSRKFRCPSCGRGISPRKLSDPQGELDRREKEEAMKSEYKDWLDKSMEFQAKFAEDNDGKNID